MSNKQYLTITHYKEREFYYLNHAIQMNDGFIAKEIEQFHESEKEKFIERIRTLQQQYPLNQVISISLNATQIVKDKEDLTQASAEIFKNNYVIQEKIDIGNIPVTLYFSPFAILYEEYKHKLSDKLTLIIGLFDRKLYIMFATKDKIQQSWTLGTRGLTEKQIASRVYKSMQAYYKIAFKFAEHIEMLVPDDAPKLLKVLREELSMSILPTQKTIHTLLHNMGSDQRKFKSSYMKAAVRQMASHENINQNQHISYNENRVMDNLEDINLKHEEPASLIGKIKSIFETKSKTEKPQSEPEVKRNIGTLNLSSFAPLLVVFLAGTYFSAQNSSLKDKLSVSETQTHVQIQNAQLALNTQRVFDAMGKSGELKHATISDKQIELKGLVWGIEPLREKLNALYAGGDFSIKPLENFMTEFSFKSKI